MSSAYSYDVAISFAGSERGIAREIARSLKESGLRVFYDEWFKVELWGKDLRKHLREIYLEKARYCLALISSAYIDRMWTQHEFRTIMERSLVDSEYLLPVRLDDSEFSELPSTLAYLDGTSVDWRTIAKLVEQKVSDMKDMSTVREAQVAESPTTQAGFVRTLLLNSITINHNELFERALELEIDLPSTRARYAEDLSRTLNHTFRLNLGTPYTAWLRNDNHLFLSALPGVVVGKQRTLELVVDRSARSLVVIAEWTGASEHWGPFSFEEYHALLAGLGADRSNCNLGRESLVYALTSRTVSFDFPIGPTGEPETFCQWVQQEFESGRFDWDRNPALTDPGISVWDCLHHDESGAGILIFGFQGSWTNQALYELEDGFNAVLPSRVSLELLKHGLLRVCVYLSCSPKIGGSPDDLVDIELAVPAIRLAKSCIARAVAAHRGRQLPPPTRSAALPVLSDELSGRFALCVASLAADEYPDEVVDSAWRGYRYATWTKLEQSLDWYEPRIRENLSAFSFGDVADTSEVPAYVAANEAAL